MLTPDDLLSPEYAAQLRLLHSQRHWGAGGYMYAGPVRALMGKVQAASVLDYGCGRGTLKPELAEFDVREYDPAIEGKDALPEPADVVVCTDVLEHIEPDKLEAVLRHLYRVTNKACFAVIATRPADKRLPDGRNAHLIIDNASWWIQQLRSIGWDIAIKEHTPLHLTLWLGKVHSTEHKTP